MRFRDYEEFIGALNSNGVKYLVIGGHALAFHVRPRATKDLDVLLSNELQNARKALLAIKKFFGGADVGISVEDITAPNSIMQLGVAPVRIDLLTTLPSGLEFEKLWKNRVQAPFGAVIANYVGLSDLIHIKEAAGRPQDRVDLRALRRVAKKKKQGAP